MYIYIYIERFICMYTYMLIMTIEARNLAFFGTVILKAAQAVISCTMCIYIYMYVYELLLLLHIYICICMYIYIYTYMHIYSNDIFSCTCSHFFRSKGNSEMQVVGMIVRPSYESWTLRQGQRHLRRARDRRRDVPG